MIQSKLSLIRKSLWIVTAALIVITGLSVLALPALSSSDRPVTVLERVQQGDYNILALGSDLPACMRQDVYHLLRERYGERLLLWGVQEVDRLEYVYAFPFEEKEENYAFTDALIAFIEGYPADTSCDLTSDPMPAVEVFGP